MENIIIITKKGSYTKWNDILINFEGTSNIDIDGTKWNLEYFKTKENNSCIKFTLNCKKDTKNTVIDETNKYLNNTIKKREDEMNELNNECELLINKLKNEDGENSKILDEINITCMQIKKHKDEILKIKNSSIDIEFTSMTDFYSFDLSQGQCQTIDIPGILESIKILWIFENSKNNTNQINKNSSANVESCKIRYRTFKYQTK